MININSMEYYLQWQLSQYSDSLEAGLYVVCYLAQARDFQFRTSDQPFAHLASCWVDAVSPSLAIKHLVHESDHLALFSAEVTDQSSCNCASPVCLHSVHSDNFVFYYRFGGMTSISTWT